MDQFSAIFSSYTMDYNELFLDDMSHTVNHLHYDFICTTLGILLMIYQNEWSYFKVYQSESIRSIAWHHDSLSTVICWAQFLVFRILSLFLTTHLSMPHGFTLWVVYGSSKSILSYFQPFFIILSKTIFLYSIKTYIKSINKYLWTCNNSLF